ncbi:hypothetical protein DSECCO2_407100 [anaerobic digester metagenome]
MLKGKKSPTRDQINVVRAVTVWYLDTYFRTLDDIGVLEMFCSSERVGHFAVDRSRLASGDGDALFKLLVTMTMFQRRSDLQIMRVLRGISADDVNEMTNSETLLRLVDTTDCPYISDFQNLKNHCDLNKDPLTKFGFCKARHETPCHLKRHTQILKRYGHFGKVPTSAALTLRSLESNSLSEFKRNVFAKIADPLQRAIALEQGLSRIWRVGEKIVAMFLSAVTNSSLSGSLSPWSEGVDSNYFLVIDSNVTLFLKSIGYSGSMTYAARRQFVYDLASRVNYGKYKQDFEHYNLTIVQQALFMFMSESNRRNSQRDCSHAAPTSCNKCSDLVSRYCFHRKAEIRG